MTEITKETIEKIQNSQKSIKITLGSVMGITLILFFFSFAMLVDKFPPKFFTVEIILTLFIVPSFFLLNRISFFWVKLLKGRKSEFKAAIAKMAYDDVDKKTDSVLQKLIGS